MPITSTRMAYLWDALGRAFDELGFDAASEGHEVFRQLVLARIIEPSGKLDSARVLEASGRARRGPMCGSYRLAHALAARNGGDTRTRNGGIK